MQYLSEKSNIPIPPFPDSSSVSSSSQPAMSRSALTDPAVRSADKVQEDSRVDHDVVGAASVRANSPEPEDHL
jgi:hypothetical protein